MTPPADEATRPAKAGRWTRQRATDAMEPALRRFYDADPRRGPSLERDLGVNWVSVHGTSYRAAWIADTEELYAVRRSGDTGRAQVTVLGRLSAGAVERALAGWRRVSESGRPGSYEWLLERIQAALREASPAF